MNPLVSLVSRNMEMITGDATFLSLYNTVKIPQLGLGTFRSRGEEARAAVLWALAKGYRLIDTASVYKNEVEIGGAIRDSGIPRNEIFITSKISPFEQGYGPALRAVNGILERLGCEYLDLCLIHWPGAAKLDVKSPKNRELRGDSWRALERAYEEKKCRAIGVSNYTEWHMRELLEAYAVKPMVNQVELHPYLSQRSLRNYCSENCIVVQAYSPLGTGKLLDDPEVGSMAARLKRTAAQVLLRWGVQHGLVVLAKSVSTERIESNAEIFDFVLSEDDMAQLDRLDQNYHLCWSSEDVL